MTRRTGAPGLAGRLTGWLGPHLARVRLNAIERREPAGEPPRIAKRRFWFAPGLIAPGNLYLRWLGAGVVVLGNRRWQDRERAIHRQLHGIDCPTDARGWLLLPLWPGVTVARHAADARHTPGERLRALGAAARALEALHRAEFAWPGDAQPGLGHGDATLRNVNYDAATGAAHWFDFDTAHVPGLPASRRRADDLRALLYSALAEHAALAVPVLHNAVRAAYRDPEPWAQLRDDLRRGPIHFNSFHFAQARPAADRMARLEALIRRDDPAP